MSNFDRIDRIEGLFKKAETEEELKLSIQILDYFLVHDIKVLEDDLFCKGDVDKLKIVYEEEIDTLNNSNDRDFYEMKNKILHRFRAAKTMLEKGMEVYG